MLENGIAGHDAVKVIGDAFRLEVKEERGGDIDHRLVFDIIDETLVVTDVGHRDDIYQR